MGLTGPGNAPSTRRARVRTGAPSLVIARACVVGATLVCSPRAGQGLHDARTQTTIQEASLEANMDSVTLVVDGNLARQYLKKYREVFQVYRVAGISNQNLLQAFVEDRLREELEFLNDEDNNMSHQGA
jgi:hypothetical protein